MIHLKYRGACWIFLAASFYATTALLGKSVHLLQLPVVTIFTWRYVIAALIFWIALRFQQSFDLPLKSKWRCIAIGLFGDTLRTTLFFITITRIGASLASLFLYTFPLFVFLLQRFVFHQPASRLQWIGLFFSSVGCILAIAPLQGEVAVWNDGIGVMAGIGVGIVQALYISYSSRFIKGIPTTLVTSYVTRGALATFIFVALCTGQLHFLSTTTEWTLALAFAVCATAIPIFCLMRGIRLLSATETSLLLTIEPIITIGLATFLFEETLTLSKALGSFFILTSALLVQQKGKTEIVSKEQLSQSEV